MLLDWGISAYTPPSSEFSHLRLTRQQSQESQSLWADKIQLTLLIMGRQEGGKRGEGEETWERHSLVRTQPTLFCHKCPCIIAQQSCRAPRAVF